MNVLAILQEAYDKGRDAREHTTTWIGEVTQGMIDGATLLGMLEAPITPEHALEAFQAGRMARKNKMPHEYVAACFGFNRKGPLEGAWMAGWYSLDIKDEGRVNIACNLLPDGLVNLTVTVPDTEFGISCGLPPMQFLRIMEYLEMFKQEVLSDNPSNSAQD
jgi:hypothetical protein